MQTLDDVLAAGSTLTQNRVIDLNGFSLKIQNNGVDWLRIDPENGIVRLMSTTRIDTGDDNEATLQLQTSLQNVSAKVSSIFNGGVKDANIKLEAEESNSSIENDADAIKNDTVLEFVDNDDAIANNLAIGTTYRTGDFQKIVH